MKTFPDFVEFVKNLPEFAAATPERREHVMYVLAENRAHFETGLAGQNIEGIFKVFYKAGNSFLQFTGHKTVKELIESIYGKGACERREESRRIARQAEYEAKEQEKIEKERISQLSEPASRGGKITTIQAFIDDLFNEGFRAVKHGKGPCRYYEFEDGSGNSYKLSRPKWRRKYVMEYIAGKFEQQEVAAK